MQKNLSALKKTKITLRNRCLNRKYKSSIKTSIKKFLFSIKKSENSLENLSMVYKKIDKAVKRGVIHKNMAARKKSRLVKMIKFELNS
uniref:Small ribosomal subunit protein bS20c n=1 Tax=Acrosorium ciliolatum TaxID=1550622 RepID=A0A1Z1M278_9FLOR|nr:ribosomal protein S20 [Acrosorium ciliolatum]ARW60000.1 ribosomal protein S20 [Acrosorium ciliolatum]